MGIQNKLATGIDEVDVIVAGGGTAGCIIAGRIAESDPELSILVIEGGSNNKDVASVVYPAFYLQNLLPTTKTALFYKGNKSSQLADREPIVPAGGVLGGGSSINFMMYTRAQRDDFNSWNTPGWTAEDIAPFMNKLETFESKGKKEHHGHDGPIIISPGPYEDRESQDQFMAAAKQVGYDEIEDLQTMDANNGISRWQRYISRDGQRQDTAHKYIHPKIQSGKYPNLHVLVESKVVRVVLDENKRAVGVEYTPNPEFQALTGLTAHPIKTVRARKQVVLTCGACGTPPVLERSGLGDRKILERAGVSLIKELPGVGKDYQDHHLLLSSYRTSLEEHQTIDGILAGRKDAGEMIKNNDKMLGWNAIDICSKLRPTDEEAASLGPEFKAVWDRDFKDAPNRPLMLMGLVSCFLGDPSSVPAGQYVTAGTYTAYPYSRGHMHITGSKVEDPLDFNVGFLTDEDDIDLKKQIWAYKKQRELVRRIKYYRGEVAASHPKFPAGSKAAPVELDAELSNITDIDYTAEDDKAIEQWIRENVNTTWHSLGTAKMAPEDQNGVVDARLNVYGTSGLKVADLSVPPENVGANTNNTALMIGEKAADIIIADLASR